MQQVVNSQQWRQDQSKMPQPGVDGTWQALLNIKYEKCWLGMHALITGFSASLLAVLV
jgi:hypothetical protein